MRRLSRSPWQKVVVKMSDAARALTEVGMSKLQQELERATSPEEFLAAATGVVTNPAHQLLLPVDPGIPEPLDIGSPRVQGRDVPNAELVYEYVGAIDRANASDGRLWTYLAFATYRTYMEGRWPLDVANWKGRVQDRWILGNPTRRLMVRHGIARLWWVADLMFDPACQFPLSAASGDPYAYVKAVLSNEDRVIGLFDREVSAVPTVTRALIEHAESSARSARDAHVRDVMKDLTLEFGFRDLGLVEPTAIRELIDDFGVIPRQYADSID